MSNGTTPTILEQTDHFFLSAEPAVTEEGIVRFVVTKIWSGMDIGRGSSSFRGGFSLVPDGKLVLPIGARIDGGDKEELTIREFQNMLNTIVSMIKPGIEAFVELQNHALTYDPNADI